MMSYIPEKELLVGHNRLWASEISRKCYYLGIHPWCSTCNDMVLGVLCYIIVIEVSWLKRGSMLILLDIQCTVD